MLLSKLMAPSGPCSRGIPKADVCTGGRRIEPAPIPNMLWTPVTAESSPTKTQPIYDLIKWLQNDCTVYEH